MALTAYRSLPPELLDKLFDELDLSARGNKSQRKAFTRAIRSCLFVSRPFRHRALRILFRHVHITNGSAESGNQRVGLLYHIISPSSDLQLEGVGHYIEKVTVSFTAHNVTIFSSPAEHYNQLKRFLGDENLICIFRCLQGHGDGYGIKELEMSFLMTRAGRGSCGIKWDELDRHFRLALWDLVQSPHLNYLWISDIHHIPLTLLVKSHVKYLRHHQSILGQHMSLFSYSGHELPYPILEVYFNSRSDSHQHDRPSNTPFQNLKQYIALSNGPEQLKVTWDVICSGAQSLEAISIENYGKFSMPPAAFTLDCISNLSYLSYCQRHMPFFAPENYAQNLGKVYELLKMKTPMKRLEHIDLELQCHITGVPDHSLDAETVAQWRQFDDLFCSPKYPALRFVFIKIFVEIILIPSSGDFDADMFIELITPQLQRCFTRLSTREQVIFKVDVGASVEIVE